MCAYTIFLLTILPHDNIEADIVFEHLSTPKYLRNGSKRLKMDNMILDEDDSVDPLLTPFVIQWEMNEELVSMGTVKCV